MANTFPIFKAKYLISLIALSGFLILAPRNINTLHADDWCQYYNYSSYGNPTCMSYTSSYSNGQTTAYANSYGYASTYTNIDGHAQYMQVSPGSVIDYSVSQPYYNNGYYPSSGYSYGYYNPNYNSNDYYGSSYYNSYPNNATYYNNPSIPYPQGSYVDRNGYVCMPPTSPYIPQ